MAISAVCTCGKKYQVDDSLAGKRVKCKACGNSFTIPTKPTAPAPLANDDEFRLSPLDVPSSAPAPLAAAPAAAATATSTKTAPAAPAAKPAAPAPAVATPPSTGGLPFFLAVSQGWSKSLVYRVYVDRDALLLLDVGPYNVMVDLEVCRKADGSHWMVKTVQALKTWVVSIGGVTLAVIGMLGVGLARFGRDKPNEVLQIISLLITLAAFLIPGLILLATWSMRVLVRRSQQLDALTADQIRQQVSEGKDKYRLAPGELSNVLIYPPKNPGPAIRHQAEVTFKHPSGSWRLLLFNSEDVRLACSTFRRMLGGAAQIDPSLERI
jgi:hypothetical protein